MKPKLITILLTLFASVSIQAQEDSRFDVTVKNETRINSEHLEFSPAFFEDGILFISSKENMFKYMDRRIKKPTMNIYQSTRDQEGQLAAPAFFTNKINSKYHEGPMCFDMSGSDMFFTRNNYVNGKVGKSSDGWINLRILKATKSGENWDDIKDLAINDDNFNTCHPSLNPDGTRLYFASDRPGGFGGLDIYYVEKMGDDYGDPVNLGPEVNSSSDEIFPFIHADGTLFFSSMGHGGAGGLDIFYTKQLAGGGAWAQAKNLGSPFNSAKDDFGLIVDLETKNGYFSSDRPGGVGQDDIYSFYCPQGLNKLLADRDLADSKLPSPFRVFVADNGTGNEISGALVSFFDLEDMNMKNVLSITDEKGNLIRIQYTDPESNEMILKVNMADAEIKGNTNADGLLETNLPGSTFVVATNAEGYFPKHVVIEKNASLNEILVLLDPLGDVVPFSGTVLDPKFNTPIAGAKVTIRDKETGEVITTLYTDKNGNFNTYLPKDRDYVVDIEKDDFKATREVSTRNLEPGAEIAMAFDITDPKGRNPFAEGNIITLPNIYYNFNDASIRPDAKPDLDALATIMNQFPSLQIELSSHTDARGSSEYNQRLSQRRADKAKSYLVKKGVSGTRMTAKGYGESQLKNNCSDGVTCSEDEHQVNRRTEFKVLGNPEVTVNYADNKPSSIGGKSSAPSTPSASGISATAQAGTFTLVAGTFRVNANAEARLKAVQDLGHSSASIQPTGSNLSAVVVGTYNSLDEANEVANALRKQKIQTYTKRN